jgi:hypothetical protein
MVVLEMKALQANKINCERNFYVPNVNRDLPRCYREPISASRLSFIVVVGGSNAEE